MVPRPRADSDVEQNVQKAHGHGALISHPLPPLWLLSPLSLLPIRSFPGRRRLLFLRPSKILRLLRARETTKAAGGRRTTRGKIFFSGRKSGESGHARVKIVSGCWCRCCCRRRAERGERGNELAWTAQEEGAGRQRQQPVRRHLTREGARARVGTGGTKSRHGLGALDLTPGRRQALLRGAARPRRR